MKQQLIAAILASAALAAQAQTAIGTSVTFYGKLDVAYDTVRFSSTPAKGATTAHYLSNDISFWGLRGSEDLGGGTRAYFKLESGFAPDTGASTGGTQLFDREAYVGYGGRWGALQLGSQYSPSLFVQARSDPYGRNENGSGVTMSQASPGNTRGFIGAVTLNNAIQYLTPSYEGFTAKLMRALPERTAAPTGLGEFTGASVEYFKGGPLYAGASVEVQKQAGATPTSTYDNKTIAAGASYDLGAIKLFGYLTRNTLTNSSNVNSQLVGFNLPLGVATVKATYAQRRMDHVDGGKANIFAVGYFYYLSRRTEVYTSLARLNNGSATNLGIWPSAKTYSPPVVAGGSGLPAGGQDIGSLEFGFRHTF